MQNHLSVEFSVPIISELRGPAEIILGVNFVVYKLLNHISRMHIDDSQCAN